MLWPTPSTGIAYAADTAAHCTKSRDHIDLLKKVRLCRVSSAQRYSVCRVSVKLTGEISARLLSLMLGSDESSDEMVHKLHVCTGDGGRRHVFWRTALVEVVRWRVFNHVSAVTSPTLFRRQRSLYITVLATCRLLLALVLWPTRDVLLTIRGVFDHHWRVQDATEGDSRTHWDHNLSNLAIWRERKKIDIIRRISLFTDVKRSTFTSFSPCIKLGNNRIFIDFKRGMPWLYWRPTVVKTPVLSYHFHPVLSALAQNHSMHPMQAPLSCLQSSHNNPTFIPHLY